MARHDEEQSGEPGEYRGAPPPDLADDETCAFSPEPAALVGRVLGGRYRILSILGTGGMGTVYRAQHDIIERAVAVKVLAPAFLRIPGIRERFFREARVANRIQHPSVIDVLDLGQTDGGLLYLVMEYLQGETLCERLARGKMPVPELLEAMRGVCSGLGAAHDIGVVHRDVTPSNIFLVKKSTGALAVGPVKILDFGIAFIQSEIRLTRPGEVFGTPHYMAPEVILGRDATPSSDVYALGAVLYEALAGHPPFNGASCAEITQQQVAETPPPLQASCGDLPERLTGLVMRCLMKSPTDRPQSMHEVGDEVAAALREIVGTARQGWSPTARGSVAPPAPGVPGVGRAPAPPTHAAGLGAWKEYLDRAQAWASRGKQPGAAMKVSELEFAIVGLESGDAEMASLDEAAVLTETKETEARERFDRALVNLQAEEALLAERYAVLTQAFEAATLAREGAVGALAEARRAVQEAERVARAGRPVAEPPAAEIPDEALLHAYAAAGDSAAKCTTLLAEERAARRVWRECEDDLHDVRFQVDRLTANSVRVLAPISEQADQIRRQILALNERREGLYRKLITVASGLPV